VALTVLIDEPGTEMVNSVIPRDVGVEVASALVEDWEWVGIILPCIDWSVLPPDKMYRQLTRERRIELLSVIGYTTDLTTHAAGRRQVEVKKVMGDVSR
jgi:hypothetical protein